MSVTVNHHHKGPPCGVNFGVCSSLDFFFSFCPRVFFFFLATTTTTHKAQYSVRPTALRCELCPLGQVNCDSRSPDRLRFSIVSHVESTNFCPALTPFRHETLKE